MGGGLLADHETHCITRGNRLCRIAAAAYRRGRAAGMDEAIKVAKMLASTSSTFIRGPFVWWDNVDAEIERRKGEA
jgi:hypothetical protein